MTTLPTNPSEAFKRRNPHIYFSAIVSGCPAAHVSEAGKVLAPRKPKPLLNQLETRYRDHLLTLGITPLEQAITLRLDPPFSRYTPDLAYMEDGKLKLIEMKGPHRFREKGIAKAALAAKTYPCFTFLLVEWIDGNWKKTLLSP